MIHIASVEIDGARSGAPFGDTAISFFGRDNRPYGYYVIAPQPSDAFGLSWLLRTLRHHPGDGVSLTLCREHKGLWISFKSEPEVITRRVYREFGVTPHDDTLRGAVCDSPVFRALWAAVVRDRPAPSHPSELRSVRERALAWVAQDFAEPPDIYLMDCPERSFPRPFLVTRALRPMFPHTQFIVGSTDDHIYDDAMSWERTVLRANRRRA